MSETPAITLREITADTVRAICALAVAPSQVEFVAPNAVSIAQAYFARESAWFRAVYAGEEPVGFVMLELKDGATPYLWRFMIAADHQRKGYGAAALRQIIAMVRARPGAAALETSVVPGEGSPGPFYRTLGFVETGAIEEGEHVMRLELAGG